MKNIIKNMTVLILGMLTLFLVACGSANQGNEESAAYQEQSISTNKDAQVSDEDKSTEQEQGKTSNKVSDDNDADSTSKAVQKIFNDKALAEVKKKTLFVFKTNDVEIIPGELAAPILDSLGDPESVYEAPSYVFEGNDKVYKYDGFEVTTASYNGEEVVVAIFFTSKESKTQGGFSIGSSLDDVEVLYGEPSCVNNEEYVWRSDSVEFHLVAIDKVITSISYVGIFD